MELIPAEILTYCEHQTRPESDLLARINRETHLEVAKPRMLSGHLQGRFLSMISHMIRPERILEIGTYTGYSALCLAEGLSSTGKLVTIEYDEELIPRIKGYLKESKYHEQIELIHGVAREVLPRLTATWDLVFIDADKSSYPDYYELILPQVRSGGFILLDNVLWSGQVVYNKGGDKKTKALRNLNQKINQDTRVENLLLPFRDGMTILRKL